MDGWSVEIGVDEVRMPRIGSDGFLGRFGQRSGPQLRSGWRIRSLHLDATGPQGGGLHAGEGSRGTHPRGSDLAPVACSRSKECMQGVCRARGKSYELPIRAALSHSSNHYRPPMSGSGAKFIVRIGPVRQYPFSQPALPRRGARRGRSGARRPASSCRKTR